MRYQSELLGRGTLLCVLVVLTIYLGGCHTNGTNNKEVNQMSTGANNVDKNVQFMIENYGFSQEELHGLDLEKFINDYQLRSRDYSADEVRKILLDEGDMYADDGTTALHSIFSATGETLKPGEEVGRIAFYVNSGTLVQREIFDIENGLFYVDDANPHAMSAEAVELLRNLPAKYNIPSWESHCEGEEEPSTGHFVWKLIFELSNGEFRVYDGYTKDMSHLPETFSEVYQALQSVLDMEQQ